MVGHLAAAFDAEHLDPALGEERRQRQDVGLAGIAAEREHRVVLEQQELVLVERPVRARRGEGLLERPRVAIR